MVIEDTSEIKKVKSKYPEITSSESEKYFLDMYKDIKEKEEYLVELRMKANSLEEELKGLRNKFHKIKDLFEVEYSTKEVNEIKNENHLGIVTTDIKRIH